MWSYNEVKITLRNISNNKHESDEVLFLRNTANQPLVPRLKPDVAHRAFKQVPVVICTNGRTRHCTLTTMPLVVLVKPDTAHRVFKPLDVVIWTSVHPNYCTLTTMSLLVLLKPDTAYRASKLVTVVISFLWTQNIVPYQQWH